MKRVVIMGRGAAGKSVLARRLGGITGLPVVELDRYFWRPGLVATPPEEWAAVQRRLAGQESWIMDGDLGPYDVPGVRLAAADTVIVLDFSLPRCAWRAARRSRERADFWRWLIGYRRRSLPLVLAAIAAHAPDAEVRVLAGPRAARRFLAQAARDADELTARHRSVRATHRTVRRSPCPTRRSPPACGSTPRARRRRTTTPASSPTRRSAGSPATARPARARPARS